MSLISDPKNKSARAVYNALPAHRDENGSDPDLWATVAAVAEATELKPATVSGLLRRLFTAGDVAQYKPGAAAAVWRRLGPPVKEPAETAVEPSEPAGAGKGTRKPRSAGSGDSGPVRGPRKAAAPKPAKVPARATCTHPDCGLTIERSGRSWTHVSGVTGRAHLTANANHKATTRSGLKAPATGVCTHVGCGKPMTKDGRSWKHDDKRITSHAATAAVQRVAVGRSSQPVAQSTFVAADLGAVLKAKLAARAATDGMSNADAVRAAVEAYVGKTMRKGKASSGGK